MNVAIDHAKLEQSFASDLFASHIEAFLRFYRLKLAKGSVKRLAAKRMARMARSGVQAFIWLNTEAKGFSTHRAMSKAFFDREDGSRDFLRSLRNFRIRCVPESGGEPIDVDPFRWGRECYWCNHGVIMSLCMRGLPHEKREQVLATRTLAEAVTSNLRGVIEQVIDDPAADDEKKSAAIEILKSWGQKPRAQPVQQALFDALAANT